MSENLIQLLPIIFSGIIVGSSLGMTGSGGSILSVPLLVYLVKLDVKNAIPISIIIVCLTAIFGVLLQIKKSSIEWLTAIIFAISGVIMAPIGVKISSNLPSNITLLFFSLIMIYVAFNLWKSSNNSKNNNRKKKVCSTQKNGKIHLTKKCLFLLIAGGFTTGLMTGVFGVGGGFIIVPVLLFISNISIQKAVTTSLFIISLVSISAV